jgi:hypothetical protein
LSCSVQDAGDFLQARIGPGAAHTVLDCCRELLELCAEHRIERVLVVSEDGDGTTRDALVHALQELSRGHFRLAMVAPSPAAFELYRSAEPVAARNGITARAFHRRGEAVQWLTGRPAGMRER